VRGQFIKNVSQKIYVSFQSVALTGICQVYI